MSKGEVNYHMYTKVPYNLFTNKFCIVFLKQTIANDKFSKFCSQTNNVFQRRVHGMMF